MKLSIFAAVAILGFAAAAPAEKRDTVAQCAQNLGHCDAAVAPGDVAGYDACHNTVGFIHSPPSLLPCSSCYWVNTSSRTNILTKRQQFSMCNALSLPPAGGSDPRSVTVLLTAQ